MKIKLKKKEINIKIGNVYKFSNTDIFPGFLNRDFIPEGDYYVLVDNCNNLIRLYNGYQYNHDKLLDTYRQSGNKHEYLNPLTSSGFVIKKKDLDKYFTLLD